MRLVALAVSVMLSSSSAQAQIPPPLEELLGEARDALDALRYDDAAAIAGTLLEAGAHSYPEVEVTALQLLAASVYPDEPRSQDLERARGYLRRLVRAGPHLVIPRSMTWPGLDSLLEATRTETLVVYARPPARTIIRGVDAPLVIPVQTTRPAVLSLVASSLTGAEPRELGRTGPTTSADLEGRPFNGDRPLDAGEFELVIEATDVTTGRIERLRYGMRVDADPLDLVAEPSPLPVSTFLPERTPRRTRRSVLVGVGVGVATAIAATALRAGAPTSSTPLDGRAFAIGGTLSLATVLGGWLDTGEAIPSNIAHNSQLRAAHAMAVERAARENAQKRAEHAAAITITVPGEAR